MLHCNFGASIEHGFYFYFLSIYEHGLKVGFTIFINFNKIRILPSLVNPLYGVNSLNLEIDPFIILRIFLRFIISHCGLAGVFIFYLFKGKCIYFYFFDKKCIYCYLHF